MRKYIAYMSCTLLAGITFAGAGIGEAANIACDRTVHFVQMSDVDGHEAKTTAIVERRAKILESIDQYVIVVKDAKRHDNKILYSIINNALKDDDMEVRATMVSSLGVLGDKATIPALLPALQDEEMWVRLAAATALGDIGDKNVIPQLIQFLENDNARLRESAALTLGVMDYKGEIPGLKKAIEKKEINPRIAAYLLDDMNNLSEKDIQDYERKLKDKSDIYARIVAVLAFGKISKINKLAVSKIRKSLMDEEPVVRALAVVLLGRLEDRESLAAIEGLRNDNDPIVRGVVALSIGKLGDNKTLPALEKLTRDKEASVRASAALAIGKLGDAAGIHLLEELLFHGKEDNLAVKLMSVAALWKLTK